MEEGHCRPPVAPKPPDPGTDPLEIWRFWARRLSFEHNSYGKVSGWLGGWLAGWVGVCHTPVLYQNG